MPDVVSGKERAGWTTADIIIIAWVLFPLWWIIALSFKDPSTISNGSFWPTKWTIGNYRTIFKTSDFLLALRNSVVVALIATLIAVLLASFAAYAVSRLRFRGKKVFVGASLFVAMFPQISLVTPMFNVERSAHLFDTWWGLIIPYIAFSLPLAIYVLSTFFREIPRDLERAAPFRHFTDLDEQVPDRPRRPRFLYGELVLREPHRQHRGRRGDHHHPDPVLRPLLPAPHRGRPHVRGRQGLTRRPQKGRPPWLPSLSTTSPSSIPTAFSRCETSTWRSKTASFASWLDRPVLASRRSST
jgi:hypothetical protein